MTIDSAGSVYCCGPGGIHDDDYRSLFITASTSLYRLRVTTPGLPVF